MKNKTSILVCTRNFFYVLLSVVIFQSCGNADPIIDGETPFVVESITKYNDTHSIYMAGNYECGKYIPFNGLPIIILPSRMYQIGDTIKSEFNNLK